MGVLNLAESKVFLFEMDIFQGRTGYVFGVEQKGEDRIYAMGECCSNWLIGALLLHFARFDLFVDMYACCFLSLFLCCVLFPDLFPRMFWPPTAERMGSLHKKGELETTEKKQKGNTTPLSPLSKHLFLDTCARNILIGVCEDSYFYFFYSYRRELWTAVGNGRRRHQKRR